MRADTPELRAVAALATRVHDQYITPIQVREGEAGSGLAGRNAAAAHCTHA